MVFFAKNTGIRSWSVLFCFWMSTALFATENELSLTEAIRGEVGTLRFNSYNQDRGTIKQGERLEYHFPYTEEKGAAVRVLGVHQECGCLSQSLKAGQEIEKGQSGELVVLVDTTHFVGNFDKEVVILTNENRERPHVFRMKAQIERLISISPPVIQLDNELVRVRVKSASKQSLHIEKLLYNEDTLDIQANQVQGAWELLVRWKGETLPANMNETIELLTDGPVKSFKIPVVAGRGKTSRISLSAPR